MILVVMCIVTWIVITIYAFVPGQISKSQSAFLYLVILDTNISTSWLIAEEFKWIILSEDVPKYLAFLVYRSLLSPFVVMLFLRQFIASNSLLLKTLNLIGGALATLVMELLLVHFHTESFPKWNTSYSIVYFFAMTTVSWFLLRWYRKAFNPIVGGADETGTV